MVKKIFCYKGAKVSPTRVGKIAEDFIIKYLTNKDKYTYVARFADTYDANIGRWEDPNQHKVMLTCKPCDIMLIMNGKTYFCEIKTSTREKGIYPSLFSTQCTSRTRIQKAGGLFYYLIYSVTNQNWYFVDSKEIDYNSTWDDLVYYVVDFPEVPITIL